MSALDHSAEIMSKLATIPTEREGKGGDTSQVGRYSGQEMKVDGEDYRIMREDEVLAVIDDGEAKKSKK